MTVGTRSVLFGAHCFFLHPWAVAWGWWKVYRWAPALEGGRWPALLDPRAWFCFFVHDLGYIGSPDMDGERGEQHPEVAALVVSILFDRGFRRASLQWLREVWMAPGPVAYVVRRSKIQIETVLGPWGLFVLLHSRYYAKRAELPFSRLCVADKMAIAVTPWWLYLPMVIWTGEIDEYLAVARSHGAGKVEHSTPKGWFLSVCEYCERWAITHADGRDDSWTRNREAA